MDSGIRSWPHDAGGASWYESNKSGSAMGVGRLRLRLLVSGAVGLAVAAATVLVYAGVSHYNALTETTLEPRAVMQDPGVDPRLVEVGVTWTQEGWCVGEFHAKSSVSSSEVKVEAVIDRVSAHSNCAGVGTVNQMAWADLQLEAPLGTRPVVRADGTTLPYWTSSDGLVRKGPISAEISHYGGLNDTPQFRLRKSVAVTDPVELVQLVKELNALPPFPAEPMNCPLGEGAYYLIVLHYSGGPEPTFKAEDRGCEVLYFVPSNRAVAWAATSPGFYPLLSGLLGE
jgi:hypothetical protein